MGSSTRSLIRNPTMGKADVIQAPPAAAPPAPEGTDLIEWYYERGYSDEIGRAHV